MSIRSMTHGYYYREILSIGACHVATTKEKSSPLGACHVATTVLKEYDLHT